MPRIARFIRDNQPTIYHVISRTALQGLPIKDKRKSAGTDKICFIYVGYTKDLKLRPARLNPAELGCKAAFNSH